MSASPTACQLEELSPSSLKNLTPPVSPVDKTAVPSGECVIPPRIYVFSLEAAAFLFVPFAPSSTIEGSIFKFPTKSRYFSFIRVQCYDWSKKSGYDDQLRIEITSKEYYEWLFELHESLNK